MSGELAKCPLCSHVGARRSWIGASHYGDQQFTFLECTACRSCYCDPMPGPALLARMYGVEYESAFGEIPGVEDEKQPERMAAYLDRFPQRGTFIDYGCGAGVLLSMVQKRGWKAAGVEFSAEVAARTAGRTGAHVASSIDQLLGEKMVADVLHLGDVIEHLTDLDRQLPEILRLLRPGGTLLVQGPLEANPNLFFYGVRAVHRWRPKRIANLAPYHVTLATASGQRALFRRMGLRELEFSIGEIDWPAPSRLNRDNLNDLRALALFALRKLSRASSALLPSKLGNRFFYAGQLPSNS